MMIRNLVVVGIDDTGASLAAMEWAADYARMMDAELKAIHVRSADFPERNRSRPSRTPLDRERDQRVRSIFYSVNPEPGWILAAASGPTAEVLVKVARDAVALVVGSRHESGLSGVLHHSVSRYCTLHARVPVVVCPELDQAGAYARDGHVGITDEPAPGRTLVDSMQR